MSRIFPPVRSHASKAAIITGASSGIGRALALELAKRGHRLGFTARREAKLADVREEITQANGDAQVKLAKLDVCGGKVPEVFRDLSGRLGGLDIVVANAGINEFTRVGAGDADRERLIIETNLIGGIATVDAAAALFYAKQLATRALLESRTRHARLCNGRDLVLRGDGLRASVGAFVDTHQGVRARPGRCHMEDPEAQSPGQQA